MNTVKTRFLLWIMVVAAGVMVVSLSGCVGAPGRTAQEVNENHNYVLRTNWLMIQDDIDKALMIDQPTRETEMIIR
jgi:hypothetical protein